MNQNPVNKCNDKWYGFYFLYLTLFFINFLYLAFYTIIKSISFQLSISWSYPASFSPSLISSGSPSPGGSGPWPGWTGRWDEGWDCYSLLSPPSLWLPVGSSLVPSLPVSFLNLHLRAVGPDRREVERENGARPTTGRGQGAAHSTSLLSVSLAAPCLVRSQLLPLRFLHSFPTVFHSDRVALGLRPHSRLRREWYEGERRVWEEGR